MYQFLLKYFERKLANLFIAIWYIVLVMINLYLYVLLIDEGQFRYLVW
jgi:hypothetical protein